MVRAEIVIGTMETTLTLAGIACLVAAVVAGRIKAGNFEIPSPESAQSRAGLFLLGITFLCGAFYLHRDRRGSDAATEMGNPKGHAATPTDPTAEVTAKQTNPKQAGDDSSLTHPPARSKTVDGKASSSSKPSTHIPREEDVPTPPTGAPSSAPLVVPQAMQQSSNQGIINNAPNNGIQNNCAAGVNNCDQSTHVHRGAPPPTASFGQTPLPIRDISKPPGPDDEDSDRYYYLPGVELHIGVDRAFEDPSFDITCESPCAILHPAVRRIVGHSVMENDFRFTSIQGTKDRLQYRVAFANRLPADSFVVLHVRFDPGTVAQVLNVTSTADGQ